MNTYSSMTDHESHIYMDNQIYKRVELIVYLRIC
jgi:hypothetical protein